MTGTPCLQLAYPLFFREADQGRSTVRETDEKLLDDDNQQMLFCRKCHAPVTGEHDRIEVSGKHCHAFPNPEGIVFEIGCFGRATGCIRKGNPTAEFSWFPPHAWNFALCRVCATHLGWYYQAVGSSFFGLILDRLVEEEP